MHQGAAMLRYIFLVPEVFMLVVFLIPVFHNILNPGNTLGILVSCLLIAVTVFWSKFQLVIKVICQKPLGRWTMIVCAAAAVVCVIYSAVLSALMASALSRSPDNAQAVIVLGCKVNGSSPSRMLARRLDSAERFLRSHPDTVCVVSGGKGSDEQISEALAMKNYLTEKGIASDRIFMEDRSVNTRENMEFSAAILSKMGIDNAAIVTDGFHQYRAGIIAREFDLNTSAINADTDSLTKWLIPTYWVREWLAITGEIFF